MTNFVAIGALRVNYALSAKAQQAYKPVSLAKVCTADTQEIIWNDQVKSEFFSTGW